MKQKSLVRQCPCLSLRAKTLALVFGIIAAVCLPQLCHVVGRAFGVGTGLGELLLPMHLPILMIGFLAGPAVGGLAGAVAPLISFLLSGMPLITALPFMCVELCVYGIATGLLRHVKMPVVLQVLVAQLLGRGARTLAILIGSGMGKTALAASSTWTAVSKGIVGLAIQWILIPICVALIEGMQKNEE